MEGSAPLPTATPTSLDPSALLWEATFDAVDDEEASHASSTSMSDEEKEEEEDAGTGAGGTPTQLRYVSVTRGATLCVRVRDDAPALPKTVFISQFDPATPEGGKGPIEESGMVEVGDFLVMIDDVDVVGKGARYALSLLQKGSGDTSVILTFRRLREAGRGGGAGEEGKQDEAIVGGVHLTEQHRVVMFKHLLAGERIDEARLKSLAGNGIPDADKHLRPLIWRVLLSYLPYDRSRWEAHLKEQRAVYQQFVQELCVIVSPTSTSAATPSSSTTNGEGPSDPSRAPADDPLSPSEKPKRSTFLEPAGAGEAVADDFLQEEGQASSPGRTAPSSSSSSSSSSGNDASDMSMSRSEDLLTRPRFCPDQPLFDAVRKDVVRTHPDQNFYLDRTQGPARYDMLLRVLFIYAKINVGTRYIQGMNELAGTLLYVLATDPDPEWAQHAEADTLFCFTHLMSQLRDVFIERMDATDTGIEGRIQQLEILLARHDPALNKHFRMLGLDAHFYSLRWITTLFCREFTLPDSIALWDALFSDDKLPEFVLFFCLAMLLEQREDLLRGDFGHCLQSLQAYSPEVEVKRLLKRMKALRAYDARLGLGLQVGSSVSGTGDLESPNNRLRHLLARVKSHVREEMPVALESFSAESKTQLHRAGAQLKNSFGSMRKLIVDNLSILPPPEGAGTTTSAGNAGLRRESRDKAEGAALASVRQEP